MNEKYHIPEDELMQQLRSLRYTAPIDITDAVMARVSKMPLLTPYMQRRQRMQRWVSAVAACAVFAVALNITILFTRTYNESQISDVIASVYNYNADYEELGSLHESAALEYFYQ